MSAPGPGASVLERLSAIPDSADASLVIRHAEREPIPAGTFGFDVALTADGVAAAERLGAALSALRTITVISSPVPRCVQTGEAMLRSSGSPAATVATDRRLGDPGAFIADPEVSGPLFLELSIHEIARRQLEDADPPPGMRPTSEGVDILLDMTTGNLGESGRLNVCVTHDVILAVLAASLLRQPLDATGWPAYLDGLLLWRADGRLHFKRNSTGSSPPWWRTAPS